MRRSTKKTCPRCESTRVVPIAFGYPSPEMIRAAEREEIAIGGCVISDDDPKLACLDCGMQFVRSGR